MKSYTDSSFCSVGPLTLGIMSWWLVSPKIHAESVHTSALLPYDSFVHQITQLMQEFPNQKTRTWKTVKASTFHVWRAAPSAYPVVILMASPFQHARVSRCIGKKIATAFEVAKGLAPVEFVADGDSLKHLETATQKLELDCFFNTAFDIEKRQAVVIDNLQALDPKAALMLYKYCDNENAPHKEVMIILMLYFIGNDFVSVDSYLETLWRTGLEDDTISALLSRVANNVVMVEADNISCS